MYLEKKGGGDEHTKKQNIRLYTYSMASKINSKYCAMQGNTNAAIQYYFKLFQHALFHVIWVYCTYEAQHLHISIIFSTISAYISLVIAPHPY